MLVVIATEAGGKLSDPRTHSGDLAWTVLAVKFTCDCAWPATILLHLVSEVLFWLVTVNLAKSPNANIAQSMGQ